MAAANEFTIGTHIGPMPLAASQNTTINGSGIAVAWVVQAEAAGSLSKFRFRYGTRTGTPPTLVATIEGLDASGNPNGTDAGGGSPTAVTFTPPASTAWDNSIREITFTNPLTVAAGDFVCITIRYSSGTVDASNNSSLTRGYSNAVADSRGMPYNQSLSGGTWTKNAQAAELLKAVAIARGLRASADSDDADDLDALIGKTFIFNQRAATNICRMI